MREIGQTIRFVALLGTAAVLAATAAGGAPARTSDHDTTVAAYAHGDDGPVADGAESLARLMEGNKRFVKFLKVRPNRNVERRMALTGGQAPMACIVCCSDSRVPPEIIFDRGLGDLFIVRLAGNVVACPAALASVEYAAVVLHVPLVVVLGHANCGAVKAAIDADKSGKALPGQLDSLAQAIAPAIKNARTESGDLLDNATRANVRDVVRTLQKDLPTVVGKVTAGKLRVVGGIYNLETGKVELLDDNKR